MKLFEITNKPEAVHAFFQNERGPNSESGVGLHFIQDEKEWSDYLRGQAADKGDTRWAQNIETMADQNTQTFSYPSIGWWMSEEAFYAGESGFGGVTQESIMQKHPNLQIHSSRQEAIQAAGY